MIIKTFDCYMKFHTEQLSEFPIVLVVPYYCDFSTECVLQDMTEFYDWTIGQPQSVQPRTGNFGSKFNLVYAYKFE